MCGQTSKRLRDLVGNVISDTRGGSRGTDANSFGLVSAVASPEVNVLLIEGATMDCEDVPGRVGIVLAATERVCAISVQVNKEQSLALALGKLVFSGDQPISNLKHLENKQIKFDAIRDFHSSFGSFWKAIHAWTATKMQNTNPSVDWIKLKPMYNNSKEDIEELFRIHKAKIMGFLLNGIPLAEDLLLCKARNHLQSLGQKDANLERKSIQFYVSLIVERGGAIDYHHAHSFLQKRVDLRNHLKSNYQFSNLMDFFDNHPKYFLVKKPIVSVQPVWFLTTLLFVSNQELESAEFAGNSPTAENGKSTKSKQKEVGDLDRTKVKGDVAAILRSVVLSSKGGVPLQKLQDEYRSLVGNTIPYQESGYSSLESMLNEMQDVVHLTRTAGGQILVMAVDDSTTDHLARLVARQKSSKPSIGRQPSAQVPIAVKSCVPALERKAILFFSQGISRKRHTEDESVIINAQKAQELLTNTAGGEVDRYMTGVYGGDLNLLFLRYPECFHVTKTGNIFPRPFKKILEFINMKDFGFEVAQRSKKPAEPRLPTPLCESPLDTRSESSYSESDSCFSEPTSRSSYLTKETSKEQTRLLFDTLKSLLRNSDTYGAGSRDRTPSSHSDVPDLLEICEKQKPEDLGFQDLIDLNENLDTLIPKEDEQKPRTRDIACQTISTGPILSMSVYNL